jgi:DegV family protein with EDD domain
MGKVRIVTDSTAELSPELADRLGVTVIPLNIHIGEEKFLDGVDINTEGFFRKLEKTDSLPFTTSPPLNVFEDTYRTFGRATDGIVSIHISAKLSDTVELAKEAASSLIGQRDVAVIDSFSTSLGLRTLVMAASEAAKKGAPMDEVVRLVRAMIPHVYLVFFVESLEYLERGGRVGEAEALLGTMLSIKPLLIIEDGDILPLEKVRTRGNGIDKLFEFITEFPYLENISILKGDNAIDPTELLERLQVAYPGMEIDVVTYGPLLATHLGPGAIGVFVYEGISA